jgi:hypothetical protein
MLDLFAHQLLDRRLHGLGPNLVALFVRVEQVRHDGGRQNPAVFEELGIDVQVVDVLIVGT